MKLIFSAIFIAFLFSGCFSIFSSSKDDKLVDYTTPSVTDSMQVANNGSYPVSNNINVFNNLNSAINSLANQLLHSSLINQNTIRKIAITSFVDLNQLNNTTTFGRVLGESMINELHIRKFKVIDFRGQDAISINARGEFHLTRDVAKLKPLINNAYVLVATYSLFDYNSIVLNARIINFDNGDVLSTGRAIYNYEDCRLFDMCTQGENGDYESNTIKIVTDGCSKVSCPSGQCVNGICGK